MSFGKKIALFHIFFTCSQTLDLWDSLSMRNPPSCFLFYLLNTDNLLIDFDYNARRRAPVYPVPHIQLLLGVPRPLKLMNEIPFCQYSLLLPTWEWEDIICSIQVQECRKELSSFMIGRWMFFSFEFTYKLGLFWSGIYIS